MMMKYPLMLLLVSLTQAAYISRMSMNKFRAPSVFRPGVNLQKPWIHRLVPAASMRVPSYVLYRNPTHRVKHYTPSTRLYATGPWKTTRMPGPTNSEYEFVRAASSAPLVHNDGGAIHTIPAPNLSLLEKPIVVIEASENQHVQLPSNPTTENSNAKPAYEVTEKFQENMFQVAKIETPIGFSKQSLQPPEAMLRQAQALHQMTNEYGLGIPQAQLIPQTQQYTIQGFNGLSVPQGFNGIHAPHGFTSIQNPQPFHAVHSPQGFTAVNTPQGFTSMNTPHGFNSVNTPHGFNSINTQHGFNSINNQHGFNSINTPHGFNIPTQHELLNSGADGIMISPSAILQQDPMFLQKLQSQLVQRFPSVEFIPYTAEIQNPIQQNNQLINQQLHLLENEELKEESSSTSESRKVVQRETLEGSALTLIPQNIITSSENPEHTTTAQTVQPHNITLELVAAESRPVSTTIKYVIESTEKENNGKHNTTPIYYAQIGQSVGNMIANGFYSAINDVRASSAPDQVEKPNETTTAQMNMTTVSPIQPIFFAKDDTEDKINVTELKPVNGVPLSKAPEGFKLGYTIHRMEEKELKPDKQGAVYAGQIVEASITEDQEFNNEKANLLKRPPLRLFAVTEKKDTQSTASSPTTKVTVVKAKIPPKSKLTFDEQTGEPVLRIYASYINSPTQKDAAKPSTKQARQAVTQKYTVEDFKSANTKAAASEKTQGYDGNQVTGFGLKLRSRMDDYIPLFDEYEE